jgi:pyruvate dehydrogenase E1 component alpha subunit
MPTRTVDGNDVLETYEAARELVDAARDGAGPGMIVAETYRMLGHAQHDAQKYVPTAELEEWGGRDPIRRFGQVLVDAGIESEAGLAALRLEIESEVERVAEEVLEEPYPPAETATTRVFGDAGLDPVAPWTRRTPHGYPDLVASSPGDAR